MTTINILAIFLSATPPSESQTNEYNQQMKTAHSVAVQLSGYLPLFLDGYWICDEGHEFAHGQIRSPHMCLICYSPLFKWVPGPGASDPKSPYMLGSTPENP